MTSHDYINENMSLMCEILCLALQSSASSYLQDGGNLKLLLVMISKMILDSLIPPRKHQIKTRKLPWPKVLLEHICLTLLHPKFQAASKKFQVYPKFASNISRHLFLLFEVSRAPIFAKRWMIEWWNNYTELELQERHTKVRNVILCFMQGSHFYFFESTWLLCLPILTNLPSFYCITWSMWLLKTWNAEITWSEFCLQQVAVWDPIHHYLSPEWPGLESLKNKGLLICLESFRVIIVLNHFEGLYNIPKFEYEGLNYSLNCIKSYVIIAFSYRKANILRKWSKILHFCYGNKGLCHGCRSQWFRWKLALLHAASEQLRY